MSNPSIGEVCLLGVGIVFVGLVSIVVLCTVIGWICRRVERSTPNAASAPAVPTASQEIPNRQEFVAAVSAAIAEDLGTDISAIRILSIQRM